MEETGIDRQLHRSATLSRGLFTVSAVLLCLYALNVVAGKVAGKLGVTLAFRLNDVGEFLVVLACMVCFVTGMLAREILEAQGK